LAILSLIPIIVSIKTQRVTRQLTRLPYKEIEHLVVVLPPLPKNAVVGKLEEWQTKNLEIFWLPPYSPELNLIEILWKFIKQEWMKIEDYKNWQNLVDYVPNVLENLGKEYAINFA
jgi:transposase